jgi:8-oxo-dGTP pyrophosphatase MutT (NUDIX family)
LELSELRARLGARLGAQDGAVPTLPGDAVAFPASSDDMADLAALPSKPAAVLVAIIHGGEPGILLTKRTTTLSSHAGQVAFPGGRIEPGEDAVTAALREAHEEVGLPAELIEVTGRLPDYMTGTGFRITPIVGLLAPGFMPVPSAAEVEEVFELPLSVLLDPLAPEKRRATWKGREREFWVWPHTRHYIWGATAAILVHLAHRLRAAGG